MNANSPYCDMNEAIFESVYLRGDMCFCGFEEILYEDQTYDIVADGELYNVHEVVNSLERSGFVVHDDSLTMLVLYAYLAWGNDAMTHLDGAYSFIIHTKGEVFVAKDQLGLKPIFYIQKENTVCISNKIGTLIENCEFTPILNKQGIIELFSFGPSISEDKTLLQDMYALLMGSYLLVAQGNVKVTTYFQLDAKEHTDSLAETIAKVHTLVTNSIQKQMKGCHASFLSGGLDSSIITSVCAQEKKPWHTYSLDYEGNTENFKGNMYQVSLDGEFIEEMVSYTSCKHTYLTITQQELVDKLIEAMLARDAPGMADVDSSLLWLCEQVSKKEHIVMSGECSDEIFGGYPWFYREELANLETFPWLRSTPERIALLHKDLQPLDFQGYIEQQYQKSIQNVSYLPSDNEETRRARRQTHLCLHWFMQTLVTRQVCEGDRGNITIRAPFADVKTLQYVYNIPWSMKFLDQEEKGILRKAFEQELPASVAHRKKNPFPKTHNPVYADLICEKLKERVLDPTSPLHKLLDADKLNELIASKGASFQLPWYGQLMSGPQLLAYLYQLDQWIINYHIELQL